MGSRKTKFFNLCRLLILSKDFRASADKKIVSRLVYSRIKGMDSAPI